MSNLFLSHARLRPDLSPPLARDGRVNFVNRVSAFAGVKRVNIVDRSEAAVHVGCVKFVGFASAGAVR